MGAVLVVGCGWCTHRVVGLRVVHPSGCGVGCRVAGFFVLVRSGCSFGGWLRVVHPSGRGVAGSGQAGFGGTGATGRTGRRLDRDGGESGFGMALSEVVGEF